MNDANEWRSVGELNKILNIPDATIRRYIRQHGHHLQLRKKHKSYLVAEPSVQTLIQIREAYAKGLGVDQVEDELAASGGPPIITVDDAVNGDRVTLTNAEAFIHMGKTMNERMDAHVNDIAAMLREQLAQMAEAKQQAAVAIQPVMDLRQQRALIVDVRLTERKIEWQLQTEAEKLWESKPADERMRRAGWFRKEENIEARERFVREYIEQHIEERMRAEYAQEP